MAEVSKGGKANTGAKVLALHRVRDSVGGIAEVDAREGTMCAVSFVRPRTNYLLCGCLTAANRGRIFLPMQHVATEIIASLSFEQRNLLATSRGIHVAHNRKVIADLRKKRLVSDVLSLRQGRAAARLTAVGELLADAIKSRLDLTHGMAHALENL
jgi:hypothetical protein